MDAYRRVHSRPHSASTREITCVLLRAIQIQGMTHADSTFDIVPVRSTVPNRSIRVHKKCIESDQT
jgi:hypothetical protein